jgi:hypothetical protein
VEEHYHIYFTYTNHHFFPFIFLFLTLLQQDRVNVSKIQIQLLERNDLKSALIFSVSNGKCTQHKQNVKNIYCFRNTRCFTPSPKNKVYDIHFAEEIYTFLLISRKLFSISKNIFKLCIDRDLSHKNCMYIYSNGMNQCPTRVGSGKKYLISGRVTKKIFELGSGQVESRKK